MKVLIVDDREDNRLLLREQLRAIDADAVTADSGVRALHEFRRQPFDLVVTDLLMPEMDGFQLCYLLKSDPKLKPTPVVIYTANYATKKDEEQAKNLGADEFITRPIDEDELTSRIRQVIARAEHGAVARPHAKPPEAFFREYSSLLIEKLEDQLITAEENARLLEKNAALQNELEDMVRKLQAANGQLLQVNHDLEAYTYSVSHDLRAPVRAIRGMIELFVESVGASALTDESREYLKRANAALDRMDALILGLLAHSRMRHAGEGMTAVALEEAVKAALTALDFTLRERGGAVRVARPLPTVLAHEQSLVQIITNLLDNGLKFVAPGVPPQIDIHAEERGHRVRVYIADNGIGIPEEHHERAFKVFERLHPSLPYAGTGIGLAIVRRGIERMGGAVGLTSSPGKGSTFWFELNKPKTPRSAAAAPRPVAGVEF